MPFASIWLGLGLVLTSIIGNYRLTLKTCAVPGTQQKNPADSQKRRGFSDATATPHFRTADFGVGYNKDESITSGGLMSLYEVIIVLLTCASVVALFIQVRIAVVQMKKNNERIKRQATIEYIGKIWRDARYKLEAKYGYDILSEDSLKEIKLSHHLEAEIRNLLGVLEHMSVGLHTGVYDKDLLYRMTATFIINTYKRFHPYITHMQQKSPKMYIEFERLAKEFEETKKKEISTL
jgi:hypothetical protein